MNNQLRWGPTTDDLEDELVDLIRKDKIYGKIDGDKTILHVYPPQPRHDALLKLSSLAPMLEMQLDLVKTRIQLLYEGHAPTDNDNKRS